MRSRIGAASFLPTLRGGAREPRKKSREEAGYLERRTNTKEKQTETFSLLHVEMPRTALLYCYGCLWARSPIAAAASPRSANILISSCAPSSSHCSSRACKRSCASATKAGTAASVRNTREPKVTCCCFVRVECE